MALRRPGSVVTDSVAGELLPGELPEAVTGVFVRAERLVVCVLRVGRDLFGNGPHLAVEGGMVLRITEQRVHPVLVGVFGGELLFEEQLAEQDPDPDIGEGAKRENSMWRADKTLDLGILGLDPRDDVAHRLVDQGKPDLLGARHLHRIGQDSLRRARHAT
jgi:hypothetical protein